jgi:hypothetical protein
MPEFGSDQGVLPPLSQSRHGDMACETLYVHKHVRCESAAESEAAARGIEIHQIVATYINHLVGAQRSTDLGVLDALMKGASGEAREVLERVRDPRITRESLDELRRSGDLQPMQQNRVQAAATRMQELSPEMTLSAAISPTDGNLITRTASSLRVSRAKRVWAEVARSLNLTQEALEKLIARGVLKLYDPRITEKSLLNFCRRHGSLINYDFLSRETRAWLQSTMDFVPHAGEPIGLYLTPLRKHAGVVHQCKSCGRSIRGNVFFRHLKRCDRGKSDSCRN